MKSLLRFILLFALIIIGKVAKEPTGFSDLTKAMHVTNGIPVSPVSFFQQSTVQPNAGTADYQLWQPTATSASSVSSFQ